MRQALRERPQEWNRHAGPRLESTLQLREGTADTSYMTRTVIRRAGLAIAVFLACGAVGVAFAAFSDTTSNPSSFTSGTFIKYVQNLGSASCGNTSDSVTVPAGGVPAGHTLIVRVVLHDRNAINFTPTVDDSQGNTYQIDEDLTQLNGTGHPVRGLVFSAYIGTALAAGDWIRLTHQVIDSPAITVDEFRGIRQTSALDQTSSAGGISANPSTTVGMTNSYDLIVGAVFHDDNGSVTQPAGWTPLPNVIVDCGVPQPHTQSSIFGAYRIETGPASFTYDPTLSQTYFGWVDIGASYKGG